MDKESPGGVLEQLVNGDHGETDEDAGNDQTSKVRVSMLFVVLPRWRSPGLSCSVSFSQRFSGKRTGGTDFVWVCFLTSLDLRNVKFQIFIPHYLLVCWNNMVAIHIFHKLVISAHLFMKLTSWGYCVVRPDISGKFRIDSVLIPVWSYCSHFGGGSPERGF